MPKILVIEPCLINLGGDEGGVHHDAGAFADVNKDTARQLAECGRTLYTSTSDDHTKPPRYTASAELLKAAQDAAKAAAKAA